jgi:hypothetical protein
MFAGRFPPVHVGSLGESVRFYGASRCRSRLKPQERRGGISPPAAYTPKEAVRCAFATHRSRSVAGGDRQLCILCLSFSAATAVLTGTHYVAVIGRFRRPPATGRELAPSSASSDLRQAGQLPKCAGAGHLRQVNTRAGGRLRNTGFALTLGKYLLKNSPSWNRRSCRLGKSGTGVSDVTYWNCIMMPAGAKPAGAGQNYC